jgi:hypothetical protein
VAATHLLPTIKHPGRGHPYMAGLHARDSGNLRHRARRPPPSPSRQDRRARASCSSSPRLRRGTAARRMPAMVAPLTLSSSSFTLGRRKKRTWLLFAGDVCPRDTPLDGLDLPLPNDPAHPDPASYQAERRALQLNYRDKRRNDGHYTTTPPPTRTSSSRLSASAMNRPSCVRSGVQPLAKQDPPRLRRCLVLLALVDGSVWWFGYSQYRDLLQLSADVATLLEKIRAQLLESAERTHQSAPSCSFSLAWRSVIAL